MSFFDTLMRGGLLGSLVGAPMVRDGLSQLEGPARSFLGSLAPVVGGALGARFGGGTGATIGSTAGSWLERLINGNQNQPAQNPGSAASSLVSSAIPNGLHNVPIGDMASQVGRGIQDYAGNALDSGIGRYIPSLNGMGIGSGLINTGTNWLGDKLKSLIPSYNNYSSTTPGQMATNVGSYFNRIMPNFSTNNMPGGFSSPGGNNGGVPGQSPGMSLAVQPRSGMMQNPGMPMYGNYTM